MDNRQAKKVILRRLLGIIVLLTACVVGGTLVSAPRHSQASSVEMEAREAEAEAKDVQIVQESNGAGSENDTFIVYFMIALIIFVVVVGAVIAVVSTISSVSGAIADEDDGED